MEKTQLTKGFRVSLKDDNLFLEIKGDKEEKLERLIEAEKSVEKFLRLLEKSFREVVWYIGTDYIDDRVCERFMFAKSGFMEIYLGDYEINAFFSKKKKADRFIRALKKVLVRLKKSNLIHKIQIK
jgi:hypothetical protein